MTDSSLKNYLRLTYAKHDGTCLSSIKKIHKTKLGDPDQASAQKIEFSLYDLLLISIIKAEVSDEDFWDRN